MNLARELVFGQTAGVTEPSEFTARSAKPARNTSGEGTWLGGSKVSTSPDEQLASSHDELVQESLLSAATRDVERGAWQVQSASDARRTVEVAGTPTNADAFSRRVRVGINASWAVNILLLVRRAGPCTNACGAAHTVSRQWACGVLQHPSPIPPPSAISAYSFPPPQIPPPAPVLQLPLTTIPATKPHAPCSTAPLPIIRSTP